MIIYGGFFVVAACCCRETPPCRRGSFRSAILGVLLLFEGIALLGLLRDLMDDARALRAALLCALAAVSLPYGYVVALVGGTALWHCRARRQAGASAVTNSVGIRPLFRW